MKKVFVIVITVLFSLVFLSQVLAQETSHVNLYLFWSAGCPHCHKEIEFLNELVKTKPNVKVVDFEISKSFRNATLFSEVGKYLGADTRGVPFTVIGSEVYAGFGEAETTGAEFIKAIEKVESGQDQDVLGAFLAEKLSPGESAPPDNDGSSEQVMVEEGQSEKVADNPAVPDAIKLPLFGTINPKTLSLPLLTFFIALVDGFNPCAMWVLLFLISLLLGFKDRKRMWILGSTFIAASALVYFLFMAAWLNFFLFFGFIIWIRLLVGTAALFFGYKSLKKYIEDRNGGCEVTKDEKRKQTLEKIRSIAQKDSLLPAIAGMILLAFAINLIEGVCSAGLPAIYTQILTLNKLPTIKYYLYIILYQMVFMLDDMVVFVIAMITLRSVGVESKYARWTKLIGGIVMILIGLLLLFKPEWLLFG